jgi:hypothetical protein
VNIAVGSAFRDSAARLAGYFSRVKALAAHAGPPHAVRVIAAEGDSRDGTRQALSAVALAAGLPLQVQPCGHGGPAFGSTEEPARMAALTGVGNAIFGAVRGDDDVLVYVESDLLWDPQTVGSLIDMAVERRGGFDVLAPMVWAQPGVFYDIYAYRKDGTRFSSFAPYHPALATAGVTEVDSAGSCLVMRGEVARQVRIPHGGVLVGWCDAARAAGYRVGVAREFGVQHP